MTVSGDLDMASTPALGRAVDELVQDGCTHVDADLAGVPFCDVSGLSALMAARERLRAEGGELTLRNPCWYVETVPVERVRTEKVAVTETEAVQGEVRTEHIEADGADITDRDVTDRSRTDRDGGILDRDGDGRIG